MRIPIDHPTTSETRRGLERQLALWGDYLASFESELAERRAELRRLEQARRALMQQLKDPPRDDRALDDLRRRMEHFRNHAALLYDRFRPS